MKSSTSLFLDMSVSRYFCTLNRDEMYKHCMDKINNQIMLQVEILQRPSSSLFFRLVFLHLVGNKQIQGKDNMMCGFKF